METGIVSSRGLTESKKQTRQSIWKVLIWGFGLLSVNKGAECDIW